MQALQKSFLEIDAFTLVPPSALASAGTLSARPCRAFPHYFFALSVALLFFPFSSLFSFQGATRAPFPLHGDALLSAFRLER
jgi:hypothetical protein